jgi:hypothetical protein
VRFLACLLVLCSCALAQAPAGSSSSKPVPSQGKSASTGAAAKSPAPDDGSHQGNNYTSKYFGFTYTFPEHLVVDPDFTEGKQDESQQTFVLLAAFGSAAEPGRREGVVLTADRLEAPRHVHKLTLPGDPEPAAVNHDDDWVQQYLETAKHVLVAQGATPVVGLRDYSFGKARFFRADFERDGPGFQSLLMTSRNGYALVFDFVGASEERVDKLVQTLDSLKFVNEKSKN